MTKYQTTLTIIILAALALFFSAILIYNSINALYPEDKSISEFNTEDHKVN